MNMYDYYEEYDNLFMEILMDMVNKSTKKHVLRKINPNMYQKALNEFIKYGELMRFPSKYIHQWKNIIIQNFMYLDVITMFFGHKSYFNVDTFNDMVLNTDETGKSVSDWSEAMEYMEQMGYDEVLDNILPRFSNGHDLISDYALEPLTKIVESLYKTDDPNEILVLINKALDISHQRSDLSELFIEGGESSLDRISGVNENIKKVIREEIINYLKEEDYYDTKLPDDVKRNQNRYIGRGVTWYGSPEQMIVVHKDQVHGMWGNIYNPDKIEYVKNLILNSEENIEFECSYGLGDVVSFIDISEHQQSNVQDNFGIDYDGYDEPLSIGDTELDDYIGHEDIEDSKLLKYESYDDVDLYNLLNDNKFFLLQNKSLDQLNKEIEDLRQKNLQEIDEGFSENDQDFINAFIEIEENLYNAVKNNEGDLGLFMVQLRDGHHRVMGAIAAGEQYVCVDLAKEDIAKYKDYITRVRNKG